MMMPRCLLLLLIGSGSALAQDCAWLGAAELDRAIPEFAPWRAYSAGQARCDFTSESASPRHSITFERSYHPSPEAARSAVDEMKQALSGLYEPAPQPTLGEAGFSGVARIEGGELLSLIGHRGRLQADAKFGFPSGITAAHREAGLSLAQRALETEQQMAATEDLAQCPHLDVAILGPRFAGTRVSLPEDGVCVIRSGSLMLEVKVEAQGQAADLIQYLIEAPCKTEAVPALGDSARLVWGCGRIQRTELFHAEGKVLVSYEFRSGQDSTAEDRAWLAQVAQKRNASLAPAAR